MGRKTIAVAVLISSIFLIFLLLPFIDNAADDMGGFNCTVFVIDKDGTKHYPPLYSWLIGGIPAESVGVDYSYTISGGDVDNLVMIFEIGNSDGTIFAEGTTKETVTVPNPPASGSGSIVWVIETYFAFIRPTGQTYSFNVYGFAKIYYEGTLINEGSDTVAFAVAWDSAEFSFNIDM